MAKVIKGTKDLRGYQVIKGASDARQIRCGRWKGLAVPVPDGAGGFLYRCSGCGARYGTQAI